MMRRAMGLPILCIFLLCVGCGEDDDPGSGTANAGSGTANAGSEPGGDFAWPLPYTGGEDGQLEFGLSQFDPNREAFELVSEVTVKAQFELTVQSSGSNELAEILSASSTDEDHLQVEVLGPALLGITTVDVGLASLEVAAELDDGSTVEDRFTFDVVEPAASRFRACRQHETLMFTEGQAVIEVYAEDGQGDRIASFGAPLFSMDPPGYLEVENIPDHPRRQLLIAGDQAGMVTLEADYGEDQLEVEIVDQADIDEVILQDYFDQTLYLEDGGGLSQLLAFWFHPSVDGRRPCTPMGIPFEVEVDDETVCDVEVEPARLSPNSMGPGHFVGIQGTAVGSCEVTMRFPTGNDGQGVEKTITVNVE